MTPPTPDAAPRPTAPREAELIAAWWSELSLGRRRQLLQLEAHEPLPRTVATELWQRGISCPLTLVQEAGRMVRRALPPPALHGLLAQERR